MVIRFNIPGAGLASTDTQLMPVAGASSRPTPRAAAPVAQAFAREVAGAADVPHAVPAVAPPANSGVNVDNGTVIQQEPPAWLDEAPVSHQDDDDGAAYWEGDFGDHAPMAPRRRAESRANPRDFAFEPTLRFHNGAPEDIPLGSAFTAPEWAADRKRYDVCQELGISLTFYMARGQFGADRKKRNGLAAAAVEMGNSPRKASAYYGPIGKARSGVVRPKEQSVEHERAQETATAPATVPGDTADNGFF